MFHKKGDIVIPKSAAKVDDLMNIIIEAGGEDEPIDDGENWEILTAPSAYEGMLEAVKKAGITPASSSVSMVPDTFIKLEGQQATQMIRLMEALEDCEDVQNVHANFDIDQKTLEEVAG
jgi:transcriptional/translational regulatory protein YebC/TACO1